MLERTVTRSLWRPAPEGAAKLSAGLPPPAQGTWSKGASGPSSRCTASVRRCASCTYTPTVLQGRRARLARAQPTGAEAARRERIHRKAPLGGRARKRRPTKHSEPIPEPPFPPLCILKKRLPSDSRIALRERRCVELAGKESLGRRSNGRSERSATLSLPFAADTLDSSSALDGIGSKTK